MISGAARGALCALLLITPAATAGEDPYLTSLLSAARERGVWMQAPWLRLGHWRPDLGAGLKSQADGDAFFLSPQGKTDPIAEGEATLRALLLDPQAQCRFPARLHWLSGALRLDPARLPRARCDKRDAFVARVAARSVTFAFSSYYLGNPSSVFGHTLLRLNKDQRTEDGKQKELLDWGVNFAGEVTSTNPLRYVFDGLTGGYRGTFTHLPYFYKVREYNDFESRDLWEYRLALAPEEVAQLVRHVWELGHTHFDYFYVDENCSWHLLAALEAAAPRLNLLEHLKPYVAPSDAVKALFATPGLVEAVRFRPSLRSQFEARAAALNAREQAMVRALEADPALPLDGASPQAQARVLDAAMDYLDLVHARDLIFDRAPQAAARRHRLLARRARLGVVLEEPSPPALEDDAPHRAHGSMRMGMGGGSGPGGPFAEYRFRALLHDLVDPPGGNPPHAALELLSLRLRYALAPHQLQVEEAQLLRVANLSPSTRFESRTAWTLQLGTRTLRDGGCAACLAGVAEVGAGVAVQPFDGPLLLWALGTAQLSAAPALAGAWGTPVRPSVGPVAGLRWHLGRRLSTELSAGAWLHGEVRPRLWFDAAWTARLHLSPSASLEGQIRRTAGGFEASATALFYY